MSDLNHPKVKLLTPDVARQLALGAVFTDFLFAQSRPGCFSFWVDPPTRGWTSYVPDHVDVAYPLWSTNADQTLLCVGENRRWFMQGYHDGMEPCDIANTVQGLLANLFFAMSDAGATDDELREAAKTCGFHYLDEFMSFFAKLSDEDYETWTKRLVTEIDGRAREQG